MAVQISGNDITVPRDTTVTRNLTVGGVLTYEDVTNVDSVGLVTARSGIEIGARPGVAASISVDGNMIISGISTFGDDVTLTGDNYNAIWDKSNDHFQFFDNAKVRFGTSGDLKIYHNGSNSYIEETGTGILGIQSSEVQIGNASSNKVGAKFVQNAQVELYHDNTKHFETTSSGTLTTGAIAINDGAADSNRISVGNGGDLKIYHTNPTTYISDSSSALLITCNRLDINNSADTEQLARFTADGAVELFHNGTKHFETKANGVKIDSSSDCILEMHTSNSTAHSRINFSNDSGDDYGGVWYSTTNNMEFRTNNAERLHLTSKGGIRHLFDDGDSVGVLFKRTGSSNNHNFFEIRFNGSTTTSGGTLSFAIETDGDVKNGNNSYGGLSDLKLKENIVDAKSQWDDIKALKVRNYNFKSDTDLQTHTQIGLIAQEVESVSSGLVIDSIDRDDDGKDLGTTTKSLRYSVLHIKALKALQEAQSRIETLEAEVAALKSN